MKLSLAPGCGAAIADAADFEQYVVAVANAGFNAVSLSQEQLAPMITAAPSGLAQARSVLSSNGLECTDILTLAVRGQPRDEVETTRDLVHLASELGAESVLTVCYTKPSDEVLRRLDQLAHIAGDAGVRLALEFAPGLAIHSIETGLEIVDKLGSDRVRLAIDTWHFFRGGSTWAELETVPLSDIGLVQFDDALPPLSEDVISETTNRRTWPGEGVFDLTRFATTLTSRGWSGIVSVEVLSVATRALAADTFAQQAYATSAPYWSAT